MAPTLISYQQIVRAGLSPEYAEVDAGNGEEFSNDGRLALHVKNAGEAPINVTISTPNTVDGLAVADLIVAVNDGGERLIGPFPPSVYNDANGKVQIAYSDGTSVTAALLRL